MNYNSWSSDSRGIIVKCEKNLHVKEGQLKIKVMYSNIGNDTVLLPIGDFIFNDFQIVYFVEQEEFFCSNTTKRVWASSTMKPCDMEYMKNEGFAVIPPNQSVLKEFTFEDLGCVGYKFKKGKKYSYYVKLNVDIRFKNECNKVWTGQAKSTKGSIIID